MIPTLQCRGPCCTSAWKCPGTRASRRSRCSSCRMPRCPIDRKSTRLNSSHANISYAVFCLKKKTQLATAGVEHALLFTGDDDDAAAPVMLDQIATVEAPDPPTKNCGTHATPPHSNIAVLAD